MFPINIIGAITGALSGATGGKLNIDKIVDAAVSTAARSPQTELVRKDAPAVAEAIKEALPAPRAMEGLGWQIFRQALVFAGGLIVAKGWLTAEDWVLVSGALLGLGTVGYRIVSTWMARRAAKA